MTTIEYDAERHVTHRCPRMMEHSTDIYSRRALTVPCKDCYSVEAVWRRIPYEPDSRTSVRASSRKDDR